MSRGKHGEECDRILGRVNGLPSSDYAQLKSYSLGSTYLCEKTYSRMKCVKFHHRSALMDEHFATDFDREH